MHRSYRQNGQFCRWINRELRCKKIDQVNERHAGIQVYQAAKPPQVSFNLRRPCRQVSRGHEHQLRKQCWSDWVWRDCVLDLTFASPRVVEFLGGKKVEWVCQPKRRWAQLCYRTNWHNLLFRPVKWRTWGGVGHFYPVFYRFSTMSNQWVTSQSHPWQLREGW